MDIEGNTFDVGDVVYTCHAVNVGSDAKRLLRCKVVDISISGKKCSLKILENSRAISKLCSSVVVPKNGGRWCGEAKRTEDQKRWYMDRS